MEGDGKGDLGRASRRQGEVEGKGSGGVPLRIVHGGHRGQLPPAQEIDGGRHRTGRRRRPPAA